MVAVYECRRVSEVSAREIPARRAVAGYWQSWFEEIVLRLEKTPEEKALRCEFATKRHALNARGHLRRRFTKFFGTGYMALSVRQEDEAGVLYVRRGPKYDKARSM